MEDYENAIEFLRNERRATVTFSQPRYISKIKELAREYPNEVEILASGKSNDNVLYAHIPTSWIRIQKPRKVNLTDEQRELLRGRLRQMREKKNTSEEESSEPEMTEEELYEEIESDDQEEVEE